MFFTAFPLFMPKRESFLSLFALLLFFLRVKGATCSRCSLKRATMKESLFRSQKTSDLLKKPKSEFPTLVRAVATAFSTSLHLKGVCHEIFDLQFFSWFVRIWVPDKQAKVFSNSVSIWTIYSITKFKKFDSAVCSTPRSQNFRLR